MSLNFGFPSTVTMNDGQTVLLLMPTEVDGRGVQLSLQGENVLAPLSGALYIGKDGSAPSGLWTYSYLCESHAEMDALRQFFRSMPGRATPFWFPTWQWEIDIANYHPGGSASTDFWWSPRNYASVFATGQAQWQRWMLLYLPTAKWNAYKATGVTADAGFEKVTNVDKGGNALPGIYPQLETAGFRPLWLRYGRIASDDFEYEHLGADRFRVQLTLQELPDEAT